MESKKILPKIKMFMWLLENNLLLTKNNMAKKGWIEDLSCCFCNQPESIDLLDLLWAWPIY
jgi:hypothetical protein